MDLLEFLNSEESKKIMENLTIAERVKYATAFEWAGDNKPTPQQAEEKARGKCSEEAIQNRRNTSSFISELSGIEAIKRLAGLTDEEAVLFEEQVFTQTGVSSELAQKVKNGIESNNTEKCILEILGHIHDNWMIQNQHNFQLIMKDKETGEFKRNEDGSLKRRNKDYQFVDLRMMPFNKDGAVADLIFLRPILEACGVEIDMQKLEQEFNEEQERFFAEKGIDSFEDLCDYLSKGSESNEVLKDLVSGDEEITTPDGEKHTPTIDELLSGKPEIVRNMAEQVVKELPEILKSRLSPERDTHDLSEVAEATEEISLEEQQNATEEIINGTETKEIEENYQSHDDK